MAIDLKMTISGLCAAVLKSDEDYPTSPAAVDVLCVADHHHRPLLSYRPKDMTSLNSTEPEMGVDEKGERIGMLDLSGKVVTFSFGTTNEKDFTLTWGNQNAKHPPEEAWMNWIAPVHYLGLEGIEVGESEEIPMGAGARVTLQPGTLTAQEVIKDREGNVVLWDFPATGKQRALANQILYSVRGAEYVQVLLDGKPTLVSRATEGELRLSLSNDLGHVPYDYNLGVEELKHLSHLEGLSKPPGGKVQAPKVAGEKRTGKPICNQVLYVYKS